MAFSIETLQRSRRLMGNDMQGKMKQIAAQGVSTSSYDDIPTSSFINEAEMRQRNPNYVRENGGPRNIDSLNIPDVVKESFKNLEIDANNIMPQYQQSKAFSDIVEAYAKEYEETKQQEYITEDVQPRQLSYNTQGGVVDYNLIARIVEECIDRKLKTLNENTLKAVRLKDGKISLQDHQGNVYSAVLEYKGNLTEQKSKKKTV